MQENSENSRSPVSGEECARPSQGVIDTLKILGRESVAMLNTGGQLLAAESRLFALSLFQIVVLILVIGILVAAIWIFIGAAAAFFMVSYMAVDPVLALLLVAGLLILLTAFFGFWIYRLTGNLKFAHSRQAIADLVTFRKPAPPEERPS